MKAFALILASALITEARLSHQDARPTETWTCPAVSINYPSDSCQDENGVLLDVRPSKTAQQTKRLLDGHS